MQILGCAHGPEEGALLAMDGSVGGGGDGGHGGCDRGGGGVDGGGRRGRGLSSYPVLLLFSPILLHCQLTSLAHFLFLVCLSCL